MKALAATTVLVVALPLNAATVRPDTDSFRSDLRAAKQTLVSFHAVDADSAYVEAEAAYHRAAADLEDYEAGTNGVTRERVVNDMIELRFDLVEGGFTPSAFPGSKF